ncbi:hypothetical protein [Bacillus infantis]|nr:hypothetical protein [Bacillus infantis]
MNMWRFKWRLYMDVLRAMLKGTSDEGAAACPLLSQAVFQSA